MPQTPWHIVDPLWRTQGDVKRSKRDAKKENEKFLKKGLLFSRERAIINNVV